MISRSLHKEGQYPYPADERLQIRVGRARLIRLEATRCRKHQGQQMEVANRVQEDIRLFERPMNRQLNLPGSSSGSYQVARVCGRPIQGRYAIDLIVCTATVRS